jgi:hypothetical protein
MLIAVQQNAGTSSAPANAPHDLSYLLLGVLCLAEAAVPDVGFPLAGVVAVPELPAAAEVSVPGGAFFTNCPRMGSPLATSFPLVM